MKKNKKKTTTIVLILGTVLVSALPVFGATSEVRGRVLDAEGNPIADVVLTFVNTSSPETKYEAKTNKKGRYFLPNLLYYATSDKWRLSLDAEGYVPTHIGVESVTQIAVVDKFETDLKPGQKIPAIVIRPLGKATVDLVLSPADEIAEAQPTPEMESLPASPAPGTGKDPWNAAISAAAAGDLEISVPLFEKAIDDSPDDAERRVTFARVLYRLERHGPATRQAVRATQLAPESLDAHMVLYSVYVASNNFVGARAALDRARAIAPEDVRVLKQVAFLAEQEGRSEDAIEAHEAITRVDPEDFDAWTALGGLYAETGRLTESEQAYQRVVELNPDTAHQIFFNIGELIMRRPNPSAVGTRRAVEAFRKAIEIKPDYAHAHRQLAFALVGANDLEGARKSLQRYLDLRPDAEDAEDIKAALEWLKR